MRIGVRQDLGAPDPGEPFQRPIAGDGREPYHLVERCERCLDVADLVERDAEVVEGGGALGVGRRSDRQGPAEEVHGGGEVSRPDARRPAVASRAAALRPIASERSSAGASWVRYA